MTDKEWRGVASPAYAVHSIHAPPIEIDADGTMTHNGKSRFKLGEPLYVADTLEKAEKWQKNNADKGK